MSLTSWFTKRTVKEIFKGILQAVKETLEQLLTYIETGKDTSTSSTTANPRDTGHSPDTAWSDGGNHFPTKAELEAKDAHEILKGSK